MAPWYDSPYTGVVGELQEIPPRAHDPAVALCGGRLPSSRRPGEGMPVGGAGWDARSAESACVGESIERWQPHALAGDGSIVASVDAWPLDEPPVEPTSWVLFHREQYALDGFPFAVFDRALSCRWVCCRQAFTGEPWWVPEDFVFLEARDRHVLCPGVSTGLVAGRVGQPVLLRGLQEVVERDAVVGAWWGRYPLEEWEADRILETLGPPLRSRLARPNLVYRFYRVRSPFSVHVTIVTLAGMDREGYCFSIGSACRETRHASWLKSILEAVQGRHYVRMVRGESRQTPETFAEHAVYYSHHAEKLEGTVLNHPVTVEDDDESLCERTRQLVERLGRERPVLFRNLTPPAIAQEVGDWLVLRVLVPGLQPLHGDHRLPQLGGPLWQPRRLCEWAALPPHPFP